MTRGYLTSFARLFLVSLSTLFTIDLIINLNLVDKSVRRNVLAVDWAHLLGLFQAEVPFALIGTIGCISVGTIATTMFKSRNTQYESILLLSAMCMTLTLLSGARRLWNVSASDLPLMLLLAGGAGFALWAILRLFVNPFQETWEEFGMTIGLIQFPSLVAGSLIQCLARLAQRDWARTAWAVGLLIMFLMVANLTLRSRTSFRRSLWGLMPALAAVFLSLFVCLVPPRLGSSSVGMRSDKANSNPHIILIVLDTLRADHLRRYGYERNTMPALERWADNALTARRAVSPAGWTTPAHASIFSGRTVSLHGVHYGSRKDVFRTQAFEGIRWLPALLAEEGYSCMAITANALAVPSELTGFKEVISPDQQEWDSATIAALLERHGRLRNPLSERLRWRMPYADANSIVNIIMKTVPVTQGPLFLFVNFLDAHSPYNPSKYVLEQLGIEYDGGIPRYLSHQELTRRWSSLPPNRLRALSDLYDGELRGLDIHLERLLLWIDERFGQEALIIITSDHGEELGEEGRVGHEYGLAQRVIHVPLFIRGPGVGQGEFGATLSLRSLYNYMLETARGRSPGVDSLVQNDSFGVISERYPSNFNASYLGPDYERPWVAVIENSLKGVGPSENGFRLLDLEVSGFQDEAQSEHSELGEALRARIDDYWSTFRDRREETPGTEQTTEEELRKLRALGYVD